MMTSHPQLTERTVTPEQLFDEADDDPLVLELRCERCSKGFRREFRWACVSAEHALEKRGWDGILLSDVVQCPRCGAEDEYEISGMSKLTLTLRLIVSSQEADRRGRVFAGTSKLWDGTITQRPSQALARLRVLAAENPDSAKAFRCLGNACHRWDRPDEAVASWRKACQLDDGEVDAAFSLANVLLGPGDRFAEGFYYLRRAISAIPQAIRSGGVAPDVARGAIRLLQLTVQRAADPIALMAAWPSGKKDRDPVVTMSAVDLKKIQSFERLADLVSAGFFIALGLTPELPDDEPTILQRLLTAGSSRYAASADREIRSSPSQPKPRKVPAAVGRNSPCPCGSGKKYKRCCARASAD
jgi:hypothetical protein